MSSMSIVKVACNFTPNVLSASRKLLRGSVSIKDGWDQQMCSKLVQSPLLLCMRRYAAVRKARSCLSKTTKPASFEMLQLRWLTTASKTNHWSDDTTAAIDNLRLPELQRRFSEHRDKAAAADSVIGRWTRADEQDKNSNTYRPAAVLVPLCYWNKKPSIIYTARSATLRAHPGEISFPGGGAEDQDQNAADTALRETEEETGLSRHSFQVWGECSAMPNRAQTNLVKPVVAAWGHEHDLANYKFAFNAGEVAEVFIVPLSHLCMPANHGYTQFRRSRGLFVMPVFRFQHHKIWGLTAFITHEVLTILLPEYYKLTLKIPKML